MRKKVNLWPGNTAWSIENKEKINGDEFVLWLLFVLNVKIELLTIKICEILIKNDIGGD